MIETTYFPQKVGEFLNHTQSMITKVTVLKQEFEETSGLWLFRVFYTV